LKLAREFGGPVAEPGPARLELLENGGEKLGLSLEGVGMKSTAFAGALNCGEVNVGGQVLFAGAGEEVGAHPVTVVCAQGALVAFRQKEFLSGQAVVDGEQPPGT